MIGYDADPIINPDEVADWKWMGIDEVKKVYDCSSRPVYRLV
jgi:isopentenyldiphosphate isomerase